MLMTALAENNGAAINALIDRFMKMPTVLSDTAFLRFVQFARDTLEGKPHVADPSREKAPLIPTFNLRQDPKPVTADTEETVSGLHDPIGGTSTLLDDPSLRPVDELEE
jgi:hypothetical protein